MALRELLQAVKEKFTKAAATSAERRMPEWMEQLLEQVKIRGEQLLLFVGKASWESTKLLGHLAAIVLRRIGALLNRTLGHLLRICGAFLLMQLRRMANPFIKMWRAPRLIAEATRTYGIFGGIAVLCKGVWNNRNFFTTIVNYTLPVVGIAFLITVVSTGIDVQYALAIEENGQFVGYVEDESVYTDAQLRVRERLVNMDASDFDLSPNYSVVAVDAQELIDANAVTNNLIRMSNDDIVEAKGVYIDGNFYGAMENISSLQKIIDDAINAYHTGEEGEIVTLTRDIEFLDGLYPALSLVNGQAIEQMLQSNVSARQVYVVEAGDSPIMIANKNGLSYDEFKKLNPTIEEKCVVGQEVLIACEEPFLSVRVTRNESYAEAIPFETEITKDNTKRKNYKVTTQEGKDGLQTVLASVEYINGIEHSREVLEATVLEAPVTEKITQGTINEVVYRASYVASNGNGNIDEDFIWPVGGSGGKISDYYGGSDGHRGLDLAAPYGTAVRAVASGKVVVSGWYYSYGKCVVIDHGNGVRTLYGHNSSLNVKVGDRVSQGQTIAGVGSTGYSTGNHLHFEVQINGGTRNPLNFIG